MELFNINWSNYNREHSYTIGFLVHNSKWYFRYNEKEISNALDKGFRPFPDMNDINKTYNHIYELFENLKINKISI